MAHVAPVCLLITAMCKTPGSPVSPKPGFSCSTPHELRTVGANEAKVASAQDWPEGKHVYHVLPQAASVCDVQEGARHPGPSPSAAPHPTLLRTTIPLVRQQETQGLVGLVRQQASADVAQKLIMDHCVCVWGVLES